MTTRTDNAKGAIAKRGGDEAAKTVYGMLTKAKGAISNAIPKHMDADRMIKLAYGTIRRTPALMGCSPASLLNATIAAAELGLELGNVMGHAYLVPFKDEATMIVGYRGYIELAARGGKARFRIPKLVFEGDHFVWEDGLVQVLEHRRGEESARAGMVTDKNKHLVTHAYVVVDFTNGLPPLVNVMTYKDIEDRRAKSKMREGATWRDYWGAMALKTVIRDTAKWVPMSPQLQRAVSYEDQRDAGAIEVDFEVAGPPAETEEVPSGDDRS